MFSEYKNKKETLIDFEKRWSEIGELFSVFVKPDRENKWSPNFSQGHLRVLLDFLESDTLSKYVPELLPINFEHINDCCILDRSEFEGSLVSMLNQGGCTEKAVVDDEEARKIAKDLLMDLFPEPFNNLIAYRINTHKWSKFTASATLTKTYIVYQPERQLWWIFSFSDFY